ncbi:MAG: glycosyltransferase family 2 protein [Deltaproteobacteria bacterium]|nr:glycosyltransferase family 2 protein [Deltaproteobacteria bacterium]MCB9487429.1 glycosyltransferase family 2 protein [Deltaproteobacteria bacterium]
MKLVIQIPAFNEEAQLAATLAELPREVPGVDAVEILVVDDGSRDATSRVAKDAGADHVRRWPQNRGLAATFQSALDESLKLGADIIVHTDADNQYAADDIAKLIRPILDGNADLVVGCRDMDAIPHFSPTKRALQRLGSAVVRRFSGTTIPDTTSGFRAYSRRAAARLNVVSGYTYTLETLIQAGREGIAVAHVPIRTNPKTRESRLISSNLSYIARSVATILKIFTLYEPIKAFTIAGMALIVPAIAIGVRFLYFYFTTGGQGKIQSLILAATLAIVGVQILVLGVVADMQAANRRLLSDLLERERLHFGRETDSD